MRADPSPPAPAPASDEAAAQKLEAGQRLALASESAASEPPPSAEASEPPPSAEVGVPPPSPASPEGDAAAQQLAEEGDVLPQKAEAPQKLEVAPQSEAAPQEPSRSLDLRLDLEEPSRAVDLQAWQAKKIAAKECRVVSSLPRLVYAGEVLLLLLWLYYVYCISSSSGGQPAPAPEHSPDQLGNLSDQTCSWNWKAFRCSVGCKPRMHVPGLQPSCALK